MRNKDDRQSYTGTHCAGNGCRAVFLSWRDLILIPTLHHTGLTVRYARVSRSEWPRYRYIDRIFYSNTACNLVM